jgi:hypothetical protein
MRIVIQMIGTSLLVRYQYSHCKRINSKGFDKSKKKSNKTVLLFVQVRYKKCTGTYCLGRLSAHTVRKPSRPVKCSGTTSEPTPGRSPSGILASFFCVMNHQSADTVRKPVRPVYFLLNELCNAVHKRPRPISSSKHINELKPRGEKPLWPFARFFFYLKGP